jgi:hypothetical protein
VKQQVHTSDLLTRLMDQAPKNTVDLDWLLGQLQKRAFALLLILAIATLVPELGIVASIAIAFPAVEMMLGRDRPSCLAFSPNVRLRRNVSRIGPPALFPPKGIERISRSRWHTPVEATKRAVGFLVLSLAISEIRPLPLINVLPGRNDRASGDSLSPGRRAPARHLIRRRYPVAAGLRSLGLDVGRPILENLLGGSLHVPWRKG